MDNHRVSGTPFSGPLPMPNLGNLLVASEALRITPALVYDLIEEFERCGFNPAAPVSAFNDAATIGLLCERLAIN